LCNNIKESSDILLHWKKEKEVEIGWWWCMVRKEASRVG